MENNGIEQTLAEIKDELAKAAITNATYTFSPASRSIFAPENLDPVVKLITPTATPVRSLFPRSKGFGQAAAWKKMTSYLHPGAYGSGAVPGMTGLGTGSNGGFADGGQPSSTTQTFTVVTAAYKNIGRDVEVGRQAIASSRGYQDVRDELVRFKTLEVMLLEEDMILNGDSAYDATAFDGLAKSITTNSGTMSLLTASGVGSQIQSPYWNYGGNFQALIANPRQIRALADDLQGSGSIQRIVVDNQGAGVGGVHLAKIVNPIDGSLIDVVASRYAGANAYLLTLRTPSGENCLEMEDLEPMSVYEPATANHSVISRVYETTVLKNIYEPYQVKITGLATS
jgi:hypothetical protein